jgi:hypothetical protein
VSAPPFFLVGSERSGTTLLRLMLAHHPSIECAMEFEFLVERIDDDGHFPDVADFRAWLATNRIFLPHAFVVDEQLGYRELCHSFLDQYCARSHKPIRGATCHKHFDRLLHLWPDARFVHLVRDGRDVARSCIGMGWAGNVWYGAERWLAAEELWSRLCARVAEPQRIDVRYEDLVRDSRRELDRIARFLGTAYDPAMLDYAADSTYERPDPGLLDQWRTRLTPRDLALCEARMARELRERGYAPSGVAAARMGPLARCLVWVDHKRRFWRFRRERYGIALLAKVKLADALGMEGLRRATQLQLNAVENRHLK